MAMKSAIFWIVTTYSSERARRFGGTYRLHIQNSACCVLSAGFLLDFPTLKREGICFFETSGFFRTTWRCSSEDRTLQLNILFGSNQWPPFFNSWNNRRKSNGHIQFFLYLECRRSKHNTVIQKPFYGPICHTPGNFFESRHILLKQPTHLCMLWKQWAQQAGGLVPLSRRKLFWERGRRQQGAEPRPQTEDLLTALREDWGGSISPLLLHSLARYGTNVGGAGLTNAVMIQSGFPKLWELIS
jgi:hypothetical protein